MNAQGYLGKTAEGDAVYVEIEVETRESLGHTTVNHEQIDNGKRTVVSIRGHYFAKGSRRRDWTGGGQIIELAAAVVKPAPGITRDDITRLVDIWQRWHLNHMQAGCVHQGEPVYREGKYGGQEIDLAATPPCPETGYRYGSEWLYEEPPAEVLADLERIGAALDGTDGLRD